MLQMRPGCERCDRDLRADADDAWICSFECTFCTPCALGPLQHRCPNCGGDLKARPTRSGDALRRHPASTKRIHRPPG